MSATKSEDISGLSGAGLEYLFYQACGLQVLGRPEGPFALYADGSLYLTNPDKKEILTMDSGGEDNLMPLVVARMFGAKFTCEWPEVTCTFGNASASGNSLSEAAMRAYVKHRAARGQSATDKR